MFPVVGSKHYSRFSMSVATPKTKKRGAEEKSKAPVRKKGKSEQWR